MKVRSCTVVEDVTIYGLAEKLNKYYKDYETRVLFVTKMYEIEHKDICTEYGVKQREIYKTKYVALIEVVMEVDKGV